MSEYDDLVKLLRECDDQQALALAAEDSADAITQLQARVAELEKDAERLNFMERNRTKAFFGGENIRASIDKALKKGCINGKK